MRRVVPALTLLLLLALAACGGSKQPAASNTPGGANEPLVLAAAAGGSAPQGASAPAAPASAPAGGKVLMLDGATPTLAPDGSLTVTGTVLNTSQGEARATQIVLELLNASGQRVGMATFNNLALPTIQAGERVAWQGRYNLPPTDWATVRATVVADGEAGQ